METSRVPSTTLKELSCPLGWRGGKFNAADNPDGDRFQMFRAAAAADILLWRDQVLKDLQHRGVLTIDTFAEDLTAPLVNQYLDVKAKHLL